MDGEDVNASCATGKVRYRDRLGAEIALALLVREDHGEARVYRCPRCFGWHLTSKPSRKKRVDHD